NAFFAFATMRLLDRLDRIEMRTASVSHSRSAYFATRRRATSRKLSLPRISCKTDAMTPAEFKRKWARYSGKETSAYQEHFNDLCALLGQPSPATADPTGSESFCFQKRVVKDADLFALDDSGRVAGEPDLDRELNPAEWTTTRVLEFPGAIDGPCSRFVAGPDTRGIGRVSYPRPE